MNNSNKSDLSVVALGVDKGVSGLNVVDFGGAFVNNSNKSDFSDDFGLKVEVLVSG